MLGKCATVSWASRTRAPSQLNRSPADDQLGKVKIGFTLETSGGDSRPYLSVNIYGFNFVGLLDSGASRTIICRDVWKSLKDLGLGLEKSNVRQVHLADGAGVGVLGVVNLPIVVENRTVLIECLVIPSLPHAMILGADFWALSGIVPDLRSGMWNFSSQEAVASIDTTSIIEESDLNENERVKLHTLIEDLFKNMPEGLGVTNRVEHVIRTSSDPIKQRYYPVSPAMQVHIDKALKEMLDEDVIEKSNSPWASPIVLIRKKDDSFRFCVDFRKLNQVTERDAYPLPIISSILDKLRNAKCLTSLDIKSAYWQIPMAEESRKYTAFTVPGRGLFHFKRMPFGLHNAPATWQRFIDSVLGPELEPYVFVYLDDIIIISDTFEKHLEILKEVLNRLQNAGLKVGREKCHFCRPSLKFLGYVVDRNGLHVDPEKVESMVNIPTPRNIKEVRSFVGTVSWYRRFVPNFAHLVRPLTDLFKKSKKFNWTPECEESFRKAKECLVTAPILTCPDFNLPFVVQTDASDFGIGAVLSQKFEDGEKVICYLSRSLNRSERNYSTTEKECLGVLWAVEKLRPYIEGVRFTVITDHYSLVWLNNLKDPQGRLARWAVRLQQFDFEIIHRKGKDHVVPDMLSRGVPVVAGISGEDSDPWVRKMISAVEANPLGFPAWRVENGRLYKFIKATHIVVHENNEEWKIVVGKRDRLEILKECHDSPLAGHMGVRKTFARVGAKYYWPKMRNDIANYVRKCSICQQVKPVNDKPAGLMTERIGVSSPWEMISVDLVGPLPKSNRGYMYILTVVDYLTKFPLLFPLRSATAKAVCKELEDNVFLLFGVPKFVICDNGPQFKSRELKSLCDEYSSKIRFTPHYHPQANPAERINQIIKTTLRAYVSENHRVWDSQLAKVACAIRTSQHEVLGVSPYYANFGKEMFTSGREENTIRDPDRNNLELEGDVGERFRRLRADIAAKLRTAAKKAAEVYNLRRRDIQYFPNDVVWRRNFDLSNAANYYAAKLAPKYVGPFKIRKRLSPWTYVLEDDTGKDRGTWHTKDLKPFNSLSENN